MNTYQLSNAGDSHMAKDNDCAIPFSVRLLVSFAVLANLCSCFKAASPRENSVALKNNDSVSLLFGDGVAPDPANVPTNTNPAEQHSVTPIETSTDVSSISEKSSPMPAPASIADVSATPENSEPDYCAAMAEDSSNDFLVPTVDAESCAGPDECTDYRCMYDPARDLAPSQQRDCEAFCDAKNQVNKTQKGDNCSVFKLGEAIPKKECPNVEFEYHGHGSEQRLVDSLNALVSDNLYNNGRVSILRIACAEARPGRQDYLNDWLSKLKTGPKFTAKLVCQQTVVNDVTNCTPITFHFGGGQCKRKYEACKSNLGSENVICPATGDWQLCLDNDGKTLVRETCCPISGGLGTAIYQKVDRCSPIRCESQINTRCFVPGGETYSTSICVDKEGTPQTLTCCAERSGGMAPTRSMGEWKTADKCIGCTLESDKASTDEAEAIKLTLTPRGPDGWKLSAKGVVQLGAKPIGINLKENDGRFVGSTQTEYASKVTSLKYRGSVVFDAPSGDTSKGTFASADCNTEVFKKGFEPSSCQLKGPPLVTIPGRTEPARFELALIVPPGQTIKAAELQGIQGGSKPTLTPLPELIGKTEGKISVVIPFNEKAPKSQSLLYYVSITTCSTSDPKNCSPVAVCSALVSVDAKFIENEWGPTCQEVKLDPNPAAPGDKITVTYTFKGPMDGVTIQKASFIGKIGEFTDVTAEVVENGKLKAQTFQRTFTADFTGYADGKMPITLSIQSKGPAPNFSTYSTECRPELVKTKP